MWSKKILLLFFVPAIFSTSTFAQEPPVKEDSTHLYKNIETYSRRNKFNSFIYSLIFKPIKNNETRKKAYKELIHKPYSDFQGKVIRNINIVTLDPFGYSVDDTSQVREKGLTKFGNSLHIKTHLLAIRNLLLIKENKPFNSFLMKESERLIRSQKFVHDVSFYVAFAGEKSDSVDIFIRELDVWSILPQGSVSASETTIGITDQNFLGLGHQFQNVFSTNFTTGISVFNTNYFIPYIKNTYISSRLRYGVDGYGNVRKSLIIDRPFFSPYAKWAAGISLASQVKKDSLKDVNPLYIPLNLQFNTQDFWAGKAIQIFKGSAEEELATNLIFTLRYLRVRYSEKPSTVNDPLGIYSDQDFYLTGIGISTRKYVKDKYIFKFGLTEDVPVGKVIELTGGYQLRNESGRPYLGMRISFGNYNEWGYLSTNVDAGTFFHNSHTEQGVITAGVTYFTELFEVGKWKFRQFVKPQVIIGLNRFPYDSLTLNNGYGLDGFNSTTLSGKNRILLTLQTQSYAPWHFIGFNFGPFLNFSVGMLGDQISGFSNKNLYSLIAVGVLIKNEYLVFNAFQVSISFYPMIPGIGEAIFKLNSFRTTDFGFRDFEVGKPVPVIYR